MFPTPSTEHAPESERSCAVHRIISSSSPYVSSDLNSIRLDVKSRTPDTRTLQHTVENI